MTSRPVAVRSILAILSETDRTWSAGSTVVPARFNANALNDAFLSNPTRHAAWEFE